MTNTHRSDVKQLREHTEELGKERDASYFAVVEAADADAAEEKSAG